MIGISGGRRTSVPKTQFLDGAIIREPSGVFRFRSKLKGIEINLDRAFVDKSIRVIRTGRGRKTSLDKTFGQTQKQDLISEQVRGAQLTAVESSLTGIKPFKFESKNIGAVTIPKKGQRDMVSQELISKQFISEKVDTRIITSPKLFSPLAERSSSIEKSLQKSFQDLTQVPKQIQQPKQKQKLKQVLKQRQLQKQLPIFEDPFTGFEGFRGFGFGIPLVLPRRPFLGGGGRRKKPIKVKKKRIRIAPSFTGIILGIEQAPIISERLGVTPFQIRGLKTGFEVSKKRKKKRR